MTVLASILKDGDDVNMPAFRNWLATVGDQASEASLVVATAVLGSLIGDRIYDTVSALPNAPAPGQYALVTLDPDDTKIGLWKKTGAAGSAGWAGPSKALRGPGLSSAERIDLIAALALATHSSQGQMSASDKVKLDGFDDTVAALQSNIEESSANAGGRLDAIEGALPHKASTAALSTAITDLQDTIADEGNIRDLGDTENRNLINNAEGRLDAIEGALPLKASTAALSTAITDLQDTIADEGNIRDLGDTENRNLINGEIDDRVAAVAGLQDNIIQSSQLLSNALTEVAGTIPGLTRYATGFGQGDLVGFYDNAAAQNFVQFLAPFEIGCNGWLHGGDFFVADVGAGVVKVHAAVLRAPDDVGDDQIESITNWTLVDELSERADVLGVAAGGSRRFRMWSKNPPRTSKGQRYAYLISLRNASDGLVTFGAGNGRLKAGTPDFFKGGFRTGASPTINNVAPGFFVYGRPLIRASHTDPRVRGQVAVSARKESALRDELFTQLGFTTYVSRPTRYDALVTRMGGIAAGTIFEMMAVRRPATIAGSIYENASYVIGADPLDEIVLETTRIAAADVFQQRFSTAIQTVTFPLPYPIEANPGELLIVQIATLAPDGIARRTMRVIRASGFVPASTPLEYGSYSLSTSSGAMQTMGDSSVGFKMMGELIEATRPKRLGDVPVPLGPIPSSATGLTLNLPAINIDTLDNPRHIPAQSINFLGVGDPTLVETSLSLRYNEWNALPARRWASMSVTPTVGGAALVRGVDYEVNDFGAISGLKPIADLPVNIAQMAYRLRIDTVMCAPFGETLDIVRGAGRYSDADNWQKEPTDSDVSKGRVEICRVLVKNDGLEVLDRTGAIPGSILFADDDEYLRPITKHNNKPLRPFRAALAIGAPVTIIRYGDSNDANGGGQEAAYQSVPGGPTRDRREHFTIQQGDDCFTNAACPVYTPLLDGDAGPALHVHASLTWRLVQQITAAYSSPVTVTSLSIGGSDSGSGGTGVPGNVWGASNGNEVSGRLAGLLAAKGSTGVTVVIIPLGTNDADSEELINNLSAIAAFCFRNGMIPIIVGQPVVSGSRAYDWAKRQETRMMRAAMSSGAAFVPLSAIHHERRNRGVFFPSLENGAGGINHYGLWEQLRYGQLTAELLLP